LIFRIGGVFLLRGMLSCDVAWGEHLEVLAGAAAEDRWAEKIKKIKEKKKDEPLQQAPLPLAPPQNLFAANGAMIQGFFNNANSSFSSSASHVKSNAAKPAQTSFCQRGSPPARRPRLVKARERARREARPTKAQARRKFRRRAGFGLNCNSHSAPSLDSLEFKQQFAFLSGV
jgi:hypothetical protein